MEDHNQLLAELNNTFSNLESAIQGFNEKTFNQKTEPNTWSAGMVTQHLILAGTGLDQVLLGSTKTTSAPADEKVAIIKNIFLNFDEKYNSPPFIEPADESYVKEEQLAKLKNIAHTIAVSLPNLDLSLTCLDFELPGMGYLTRLELLSFLIYHTQRHTHQLNELANNLNP